MRKTASGEEGMWRRGGEAEARRFYFASEVSASGGGVYPVNGEGHAKAFWRLIQAPQQLKWEQRFAHLAGLASDLP
jgi:hypothetical protein